MTKSAKSVFYFGVYVLLTGMLVYIIPEQFISLLKLPDIPLPWAKFIGLLTIIIGSYDIICGRNNVVPLIRASVYLRLFFFTGVLLLFITGQMPKEILPLAIIDLAGAVWTMLALNAESKK